MKQESYIGDGSVSSVNFEGVPRRGKSTLKTHFEPTINYSALNSTQESYLGSGLPETQEVKRG